MISAIYLLRQCFSAALAAISRRCSNRPRASPPIFGQKKRPGANAGPELPAPAREPASPKREIGGAA